jgi:hypothetical protein
MLDGSKLLTKLVCVVTIILFCGGFHAHAQRFTIKGVVADSTSGGLPNVTVMLMNKSDSTLAGFAAGNAEGRFELKSPGMGPYLLKINYTGYVPFQQTVQPPASGDVLDMGTILLPMSRKELKEVIIEGERVPITIKKDTIEFDAQAFKTVPNANVEELLKKLPGVEVDKEGNVTAQGKQVQKVLVDGKVFFGGQDPKMATKNLPADAISKVQVFEKKSETADFTGIDDGVREQTINLELKEDRKNGSFGKIEAGAGNDERYKLRGNINRFSKGNQFSVIGTSNNVNEPGFSFQEYLNFSGNTGGGGGGRRTFNLGGGGVGLINNGQRQNGIMENYAGGLNVNRQLNKKTELNASYFYNQLNHLTVTDLLRENFLPTGSFFSRDNTTQNNTNFNHRANASLDYKLDSMNSLKFTTIFSRNETLSGTLSETESFRAEDSTRQNTGRRNTQTENVTFSSNNTLLWRHKFAKRGRTFTANNTLNLSARDRNTNLEALNTFGESASQVRRNILQATKAEGNTQSYGTTLTFTEPIARRVYWETNYSFTQNDNVSDQEVRDTDSLGNIRLNNQLTNKFNSTYRYHKPGMNIKINRTKYNATVGVAFQETQLYGNLPLRSLKINRSFGNVLPVARFNYDFSSSRRLSFDYETSIQEPTIQQLQPIVDNSDPLNITTGNQNLKPAYLHNLRTNYFFFNPVTFMGFFATASYTYEMNAIVNAQEVDNQLVRITRPVNVGENTRAFVNGNLSFPIKKIGSRIRVGSTLSRTTGINLLNNEENTIRQDNISGNVQYQYIYKEFFEQNIGYRVTRQESQFAFAGTADQLFLNQSVTASSLIRIKKRTILNGDLDYLIYRNDNNGFYQELPLLNLSISRLMLKNDKGEIKFSVVNLLDRDLGITQDANVNFVETTRINNLGRYFMVSFIYSINKHLDMMNSPGAGRMFRMMR